MFGTGSDAGPVWRLARVQIQEEDSILVLGQSNSSNIKGRAQALETWMQEN